MCIFHVKKIMKGTIILGAISYKKTKIFSKIEKHAFVLWLTWQRDITIHLIIIAYCPQELGI